MIPRLTGQTIHQLSSLAAVLHRQCIANYIESLASLSVATYKLLFLENTFTPTQKKHMYWLIYNSN